jgi:CheY-like chemotaxis protein/anti-sigma regulatory factor (Ser/Thr protein kinase)
LPLNIITGFSEMMVMSPASYDEQALPPAYRTDVEAIHRASYHLSNLIDDVLDLSEIDAHKMTVDKEWLSIGDVVGEAAATASGLFQSKALSLAVELPADLPTVYADRTRVKQVVLNLLKNAARFTDAGGATVSASVRENDVVVSVADTGIGIAPQDVPHVFEEFRQLEAGGQRRVGGSGLGLTISKQFVELHGGTMWLESRPGWGTTFCFSLPLCANVAAATMRDPWETWARPRPVAGPDTAPSVAVIGHDQHTLRLLQHALDTYRLVPVTEPAEIGRLRAEGLVQAAVVVESPDRKERRGLRDAVAQSPSLVTIGCAFRTRRSEAVKSLDVVDYLAKPVDRGSVARALASLDAVERVLVVDDDPDMARLLASMVASLPGSYRVWQATDGEEALRLISAHRPQAVLLDLLMPGVDGHEVLRRLRAVPRLRDTAVIVVSAGAPVEAKVTAEITAVARADGLTLAEFSRGLKSSLDAVLRSPEIPRAPTAGRVA